jgi:type II secretory pathway pseudopilin PulG
MNKVRSLGKQKGFQLVETMVVLVIVIGLLLAFWPQMQQAFGFGDAAKLRTQVSEIQQGANLYKQRNNVYTGVSMAVLEAQGYVSDRMGTGVGRNPWGGNYTVAAGANATQVVITATGITDAQLGAQMAADYATSAVAAAFAGTTLTLTFQG